MNDTEFTIFDIVEVNKQFTDEEIFNCFVSLLIPEYLTDCKIKLQKNSAASYNSVIAVPQNTVYRQNNADSIVLARIKTIGKSPYISFAHINSRLFDAENISYNKVKSDDYLRIDLSLFVSLCEEKKEELSNIITTIFAKSFNFPSFGCCSRYKECSNAGKCIHPDILYATACMYKKNLDEGKVFYN
ncbi:MAG: hypothetical protein IJ447_01935 [Clostridia bacterium]|nr:hypothetical protein [Clostridia bacterium]